MRVTGADEELPDSPLDDERDGGWRGRREVGLGLVLAGLVLAFAIADWWRQEDQARAYQAAQAAAQRRDWDAAQPMFAGLGAYHDAPSQAQAAATQVARRDAAYQAGLTAAARGDPFTAYRAFSTTLTIAPAYRDAAPRLAAAAGDAGRQLTAVIYRRADGSAPGLYLRQTGALPDLLLPGSDSRSRVWATDAATGRVVYDTSGLLNPSADFVQRAVRVLSLAEITARGVVTTVLPSAITWMAMPDGMLGRGAGVLGRAGLWWHMPAAAFRLPLVIGGYANEDLVYFDRQTGTAVPVALPPDWGVLDIDPAGARLLLGEYRGLRDGGVPSTRLYLAGPRGEQPRQIALAGGTVRSARFSPDGAFVLYDAYDGPRRPLAALHLLDLRADPPQDQPVGSVVVAYGSEAVPLAGMFLPGPGPPRLLIKISNGISAAFSVREVGTGRRRSLWERPSAGATTYWITADARAVLVPGAAADDTPTLPLAVDPSFWTMVDGGAPPVVPDDADQPHYELYPLSLESPPRPLPLALPPLPPPLQITRAEQAGGYVVYTVDEPGVPGGPSSRALYSVGFGGPTRLLLQTRGLYSPDVPQMLLFPNELLAYISPDRTLHLLTLDGAVALPVLPGVDGLWPFGIPTATPWEP